MCIEVIGKRIEPKAYYKSMRGVGVPEAFGSALSSIVGSDSVTEEGLLFAEPFSVCVSAANVMLHVSREA